MNALVRLTLSHDGSPVYVVPGEVAMWHHSRAAPHTMLTLRNGHVVVVTETPEQVTRLFTEPEAPPMPEGMAKFAAPPGGQDFGLDRSPPALCAWCGDPGCTECEAARKRLAAEAAHKSAAESLRNYGDAMRDQAAIIRRRNEEAP